MVWNDPNELTWAEGSPLTSDDMINYVKNNLLALRNLNSDVHSYYPSSNIGTNSQTFVDVDPINLKVELEITSDKLLCFATFKANKDANGYAYYDLVVNADAINDVRAGDPTTGLVSIIAIYYSDKIVTLIGKWTGLQPGLKTVRLQMRSSNADLAQVMTGQSVIMAAFEV